MSQASYNTVHSYLKIHAGLLSLLKSAIKNGEKDITHWETPAESAVNIPVNIGGLYPAPEFGIYGARTGWSS